MESVRRILIKNPRDTASSLSALLFLWTYGIFKKGYQGTIKLTDLYETLPEDRSSSLGDRLERNWNKQKINSEGASLIKALVRTFWRNYVWLALIELVNNIIVRLAQPYFLGQLLVYFRQDSAMTFNDGLWYTVAIVVSSGITVIGINQNLFRSVHIGMQIRVSLCSLIYRKSLKLSQRALRQAAVINLLSNDVHRFDNVVLFGNALWSAPLMTIIITCFLWQQARWAGMIGIAVLLFVVSIQSYTGKLTTIFRLQTALRTDKRIKFMEEIITGVRVIKMFGWEIPFVKMINSARKMELNIIRKNSYVRGLNKTLILFNTRLAMFCTMLPIWLMYGNEEITTTKVFVIAAYFQLITVSMSQLFIRGISEVAEGYVSVKRLEKFLQYDEIEHSRNENGESESSEVDDVGISVKNLKATWTTDENVSKSKKLEDASETVELEKENLLNHHYTLNEINVRVKKGSLIGIVGPIGSGKSSFLQALLNEMPLEGGSVKISGSVSYAAQEPWIFTGSFKQNIIFNNSFDEDRYYRVIRACALDVDIGNFENGDKLLIGDRGISLSGGQKARVNLARCIYRDADTYLFDDPLSAVDTHVGRHLFNECIGPNGFLAKNGCTRILVTHQVNFLNEADLIAVLRNGVVDFFGTPTELSNLGIDFSEFLQSKNDISDAEDDEVQHKMENLNVDCKEEVAKLEDVSKNKSRESTFKAYLRYGANYGALAGLVTLIFLSQILASGCDYWVAFWTGQEEKRHFLANNATNGTESVLYSGETRNISESVTTVTNLLPTDTYVYIHATLILALFIVALTRAISFHTMCIRASLKLHNVLFKGIMSTSLHFFDTNPSGRILNLFSKDLGTVDDSLAKSLFDAIQNILTMIGSISLTAIVRPYFLIPIILIGMVFTYIRKIYLSSSRDLKRMEGITRSPVFTHLSASIQGMTTIRAMKAENVLIEEFDNHQDLHSSSYFMFISTNVAFALCMDFLSFLIVSFVTFTFLLSGQSAHSNEVGLTITQIMALTLQIRWGMRQSAEVSNHLMSVERILQYRDLPPEPEPEKMQTIAKGWPSNGKIEFRNLSYRYSETNPPILTNLSLTIKPKEKIGICGRTGAGKSSLIGAIFRLAINDGDIFIDGINTSTIGLHDLRSNISIIPQDPVLFSGTLRRNLDPFEIYSDDDIWSALNDVELKHIASEQHGLQRPVLSNGSNFSVGEKQLLCLARAILQKSKILIADEATGNMSLSADQIIQQKIREKFVDCTVLTIAHRLNTIIDSDRILVLGNGEILEFSSPAELLESKGVFYGMISSLGKNEADKLMKLAKSKQQ